MFADVEGLVTTSQATKDSMEGDGDRNVICADQLPRRDRGIRRRCRVSDNGIDSPPIKMINGAGSGFRRLTTNSMSIKTYG